MTENSISCIPIPEQGNNSSEPDSTKVNNKSSEAISDLHNIKSKCTNTSTAASKSVSIRTSDVDPCSSAFPSDPNVPYQESEGSRSSTEQAELLESSVSAGPQRSLASEVLEKARTRFDMFWGKSKPNPEDDNQ